MKLADAIGAGEHQVFVAAVELRAAEVARVEIHPLDRSSGSAVKDHDALRQQAAQDFNSFSGVGHHALGPRGRSRVELLDYRTGAGVAIWSVEGRRARPVAIDRSFL